MLEIGSVIDGKYKILNIIGRGGMSIVYLAMNEKVNRQWAIKEIIKSNHEDFRMDKKEIEMMKRLKHPHLPNIVDMIERQGSLLIVMDYIQGQSLGDILMEEGAQPVESVLDWARQLCQVLRYLHTRTPKIIYRDMKPGNVMRKPDGNLMLIDFGAAREYNPQNAKDTISLGTRGYAAPEQYRQDGQSDERTDIYCLGVTLFQLLTGESPYELRPIRNLKPELSSGLEAIITKCTQVKKEDRYQSVAELQYAIAHYWEYDAKYRIAQKRKLIKFMIPTILAILFAVGTFLFALLENYTQKSNYDAYLYAAKNSTEKSEEISNYEKAINLNPQREEAYICLLKNGYLEDNFLTKKESEQLRNFLISYGDGNQTNERAFQRNLEGYEKFAYEAGIAYFYKYEEKENKKNAKGYFEIAVNSDVLEEKQKERAKRLLLISEYYSSIGRIDEAGDVLVTYLDYWKDLVELSAGNLVETDNERTALVMYEELVSQIVSRIVEFQNAGVGKEEILLQLANIKEHLNVDFADMSKEVAEVVTIEIEALEKNLEKAEKIVQSVYEEKEEEAE